MTLRAFHEWPLHADHLAPLYEVLRRGQLPHALLFVGQPEVTRDLTEFLAKIILCQGDPVPCGTCDACKKMERGAHPDYHVIDADAEASLKTAEVEALQARLALRAHSGSRTVYAVRGIDRATPVAANRLLKTLEEPPGEAVALLTARQLPRVLPTIVSRCQVYRLGAAGDARPWEDQVALASAAAEGRDSGFAALLPAVIQWTEMLLQRALPSLALAEAWLQATAGADPADALHLLALWLRDILHWRVGDARYIRFAEHGEDLARQAAYAEPEELAAYIALVTDARARLQSHVAAALNAEQLCVRLFQVRKGGPSGTADTPGQPR